MRFTHLHLLEAPKKICPICGNPMTGYHYWYKGGWRCKKSSIDPNAQPANNAAPAQPAQPAQPANPATAPATNATPINATPRRGRSPVTGSSAPTSPSSNQDLKQKINNWLKRFSVENFTINADNTVDVAGHVTLDDMNWKQLPVKFNKVDGSFVCFGNLLESAENLPSEVTGELILTHNNLTSAVGGPQIVGGDVNYSSNPLESIEGLPTTIGGSLICENCDALTSLRGIHKSVKRVNGEVNFYGCPIESHVLGLIMIRGVEKIVLSESKVADILNKHLEDRDVAMCQDELIDAGFASFAKL